MLPPCNCPEGRWSGPRQSRGGDTVEPPHQAQSGSSRQETQTAASCEYCNYGLSSAFHTPRCCRVIDYLFTYTHSPVRSWKDMLNTDCFQEHFASHLSTHSWELLRCCQPSFFHKTSIERLIGLNSQHMLSLITLSASIPQRTGCFHFAYRSTKKVWFSKTKSSKFFELW